jgi:hypothetical protein
MSENGSSDVPDIGDVLGALLNTEIRFITGSAFYPDVFN